MLRTCWISFLAMKISTTRTKEVLTKGQLKGYQPVFQTLGRSFGTKDDCEDSTTWLIERDCKLPCKLLDFFTGLSAISAGNISPSTDPQAVEDELTSLW